MELRLPIELANQIIGYLGTRPYQEVYQLIDGMKAAAVPPEKQDGNQVDIKGDF